jgi:hypothetical protein
MAMTIAVNDEMSTDPMREHQDADGTGESTAELSQWKEKERKRDREKYGIQEQ